MAPTPPATQTVEQTTSTQPLPLTPTIQQSTPSITTLQQHEKVLRLQLQLHNKPNVRHQTHRNPLPKLEHNSRHHQKPQKQTRGSKSPSLPLHITLNSRWLVCHGFPRHNHKSSPNHPYTSTHQHKFPPHLLHNNMDTPTSYASNRNTSPISRPSNRPNPLDPNMILEPPKRKHET